MNTNFEKKLKNLLGHPPVVQVSINKISVTIPKTIYRTVLIEPVKKTIFPENLSAYETGNPLHPQNEIQASEAISASANPINITKKNQQLSFECEL